MNLLILSNITKIKGLSKYFILRYAYRIVPLVSAPLLIIKMVNETGDKDIETIIFSYEKIREILFRIVI